MFCVTSRSCVAVDTQFGQYCGHMYSSDSAGKSHDIRSNNKQKRRNRFTSRSDNIEPEALPLAFAQYLLAHPHG
ncbi:unnamed protein product, partial [Nesidiocoris tenuis]